MISFLKNITLLASILAIQQLYAYNEQVDSLNEVLKQQSSPEDRAETLMLIGNQYFLYTNDTAIYYYKEAEKLARRTTSDRLKAEVTYRLALCYQYVDPVVSAEYTMESVQYSEKTDDARLIGYARNMLGNLYRNNGEWDKAKEEYQYALNVASVMDDSLMISRSYNNIGIVHMLKGEYDIGEEYWLNSLDIKLRLGMEDEASATMSNIALYYKDIGRYYEAKELLDRALEINFNNKDYESVSFCYTIIGDMYWRMENDLQAVDAYKSAIAYSDTISSYYDKIDPYIGLSRVLDSLGRHKEALHYHRLYTEAIEKWNSENNARITRELTTQFETEKKEQENEQLKGANKAKDAQIKLEEANVRYLWTGLGLVFLILILIVFVLNRVRSAKKEIEHQKHIVEEKNREITDSINYAQRLQNAILPTEKAITSAFPKNFVFYRPKDIVAGDFYWMEESGDLVHFAVADCTGHGVPGAMVSVVCNNALNRAVREFDLKDPGKILDKVTDLVIETFEKSDEEVKDGMDVCLCTYDKAKKKMYYSGANNSLYHIHDAELNEYKATKQPIGKYANRLPFQTVEIDVLPDDSFYLFTDGYADQFGGEKGKKMKYKPFKKLLVANHMKGLEAQKIALEDAFDKWSQDYEQVDDVCVIGFRL